MGAKGKRKVYIVGGISSGAVGHKDCARGKLLVFMYINGLEEGFRDEVVGGTSINKGFTEGVANRSFIDHRWWGK